MFTYKKVCIVVLKIKVSDPVQITNTSCVLYLIYEYLRMKKNTPYDKIIKLNYVQIQF